MNKAPVRKLAGAFLRLVLAQRINNGYSMGVERVDELGERHDESNLQPDL